MSKLETLHQCGKRVKTKSQKMFWGLIPTFVEVKGKKLVEGDLFAPPPSLPLSINILVFYYALCVTDIYGKYAWVVPLKGERSIKTENG